ncbi:MAG TPA: PKD domain-containing protein [Pyrinomonadaceae bacterium]|nr:PKD domain-containing protein [Pyrinomonadaceae bacterium]
MMGNLLAWNFSPIESFGDQLFDRGRVVSDLPLSRSLHFGSDVRVNLGFDFFAMPVPQAGSSKIVFTSNRDGNAEIYSMNADGSSLSRLTTNDFNDDHPRWSADGTKILFQSDRDNPETGNADVYVMNANGSGQTRLTTDIADDSSAVWSPDGTKIVFQSLRNGVYYQVYVMNADGTNQLNISNGIAADTQPSWSPNGLKIAFASERDHAGRPSVYVMNSDGLNQTRLTFSNEPFRDEQPNWSRDATKIAFVSTRDSVIETWQETDDEGGALNRSKVNTNKEVYKMNADGSNQIRLTNTLENDDSPYWSPDGTQIIFHSDREREAYDPTQQLWTMNADGTSQTLINGNEFGDYSPSWNTGTANQSPIANPGGPYSGVVAQNVPFDGSASFDPDGSIVSYSWNFGDGNIGSGAVPTNTYASTGNYAVTLTVTDNQGAQATANTSVNITAAGGEHYLANFNLSALAREPYANESAYWLDILRAAHANGQNSKLLAVREMGKTLFESADYAVRNRNNHWYVYDLYKTYLMREPDAPGWAWWENELNKPVNPLTREQLRGAFDESIEFGNIVATLTPVGSPSSAVTSVASARVDPFNQPGNGLTARDTAWSVPLLNLPGRAGLDLGLHLSYTSLVWTRSGPYIYFDEDNGWPSPGFRLGFPTIQGKVFDAQAGDNVYLMITGGSRVSLRQVGTSNVYEAADSSYLQLIDNGGSLLVRTTDGTQLSYQPFNDGWHCTQIKDRNGNYLTVSYDWRGDITTIIDTLARPITFNYDTNANLTSITQTWAVNGVPTTHTWATFGWETRTVQSSSSGVMATGAFNGSMPMLNQVGLDDGSRYNFEYTPEGQVKLIRRHTADNQQRSSTAYNYESIADDCPRLFNTRVSAENWTGINGVPNEVVTTYSDPGDGSHTVTAPDGTLYKEFYGTGWQRGLTVQSEVWSAGVRQKWTTNTWRQDNESPGITYQTNPRISETNVHDASNHRRTTIDYQAFALPSGANCTLPTDTREYAGFASTALRHTHTSYRMDPVADATYLNLHILGLVKEKSLFEVNTSGEIPMSKVGFQYDESGSIDGSDAPVGHDNAYDGNFIIGRGNLSSVKRYDVLVTDNSQFSLSRMKYNTAGAVVSTKDPLNHEVTLSYVDSFSANGANLDAPRSFATFAFPTTITDPAGNSSYLRYHYDIGAKTRTEGPAPDNQPEGAIHIFVYDAAARIERVTTTNNSAYQRFVYGPNYVQTFGTVNNVADEAYAIQAFDGAGRVMATSSHHPGSTGGYKAQLTQYDFMGRAVKQSNPTEIDSVWSPAGDDDTGCLFTQQTYNWQGKPLVTTNTDGTIKEATYSGCGCAGGDVVTLTDEGTMDAGVFKRRQQKIYSDVLGRTVKTELRNWEGGSVYSTVVNEYNARDQVTSAKQYQGAAPTGVYQETTMTYDGHGRLKTKHIPSQQVDPYNSASSDHTTWTYNDDDTTHTVTDARGITATYGYNSRHLLTGIGYSVLPGVTPTAPVTFAYDSNGNRISMTDGLGKVVYTYDSLSRMKSEARTFTGVGTFPLTYSYNLGDQLKKITDPTNGTINYEYDSSGRTFGVTGSDALYAGVSNYGSNIGFRAWGGVQRYSFGNNHQHDVSLTHTNRMQISRYEINYTVVNTVTTGAEYDYYPDGQLESSVELNDTRHQRFYRYDHASRLVQMLTGAEARGETVVPGFDPSKQNYNFDVWGNLTSRTGHHWGVNQAAHSATYQNNRNIDALWHYSADGDLLQQANAQVTRQYSYDAAGRQTATSEDPRRSGQPTLTITQDYDGDGRRIRSVQNNVALYEIRSSVLGARVITEVDSLGVKKSGYVYANGAKLAKQTLNQVTWVHEAPDNSGEWESNNSIVMRTLVLDSLGNDLGVDNPYENGEDGGLGSYPSNGDASDFQMGCAMDGHMMPCDAVMKMAKFASGIEIHRSVGMMLPRIVNTWVPDDSKDQWNPNLQGTGDSSGDYYIGDGGHFEVHADEGGVQWLSLLPILQASLPVPLQSANELREEFKKLLSNKECADFVNSVIAEAEGKVPEAQRLNLGMEDLFENISGQGGYVLDPNITFGGYPVNGLARRGTTSIDQGNAQAVIRTRWFYTTDSPRTIARNFAFQRRSYLATAFHESFHFIGRSYAAYSDEALGRAAFKITGNTRGLPSSENKALDWSSYFDNQLMLKCMPDMARQPAGR